MNKIPANLSSARLKVLPIICATLLLLTAIGAWSYIHKQQLSQQNKQFQAQQARVKANDAFKKNQDCQQYAAGIKSALDKNNSGKFALRTVTFETLFYSPKDNTCLYAYQSLATGAEAGKREYFVYDALTNNKVTSFQFPQQYDAYKKFLLDYSDGQVRL